MKQVQFIFTIFAITFVNGAMPPLDRMIPDLNCSDDPFQSFPDVECDQYWECGKNRNVELRKCPPGLIFDFEWMGCFLREEGAICWSDQPDLPDQPGTQGCTMQVEHVNKLVNDLHHKIDKLINDMASIRKIFNL